MITTGLMKSERIAAERAAERERRRAEAAADLDPRWPYAVLPFPETFGVMDEPETATPPSQPPA